MIRIALLVIVFLTATACTLHAAEPPTTVLLVRHAEKVLDGQRDPVLTDKGTTRAAALAMALADAGISAIYSTPFKRTMATAAPTAAALGLTVQSVKAEAGFPKALADEILATHRGKTVLVVGHSNTLGPTIAALGAGPAFILDESRYGDLFICTIPKDGPASMVRIALQPW